MKQDCDILSFKEMTVLASVTYMSQKCFLIFFFCYCSLVFLKKLPLGTQACHINPEHIVQTTKLGTCGKEHACQCTIHKRCRFYPWVEKIPWITPQQPTPVFLPGEFHGQRSLAGYSL